MCCQYPDNCHMAAESTTFRVGDMLLTVDDEIETDMSKDDDVAAAPAPAVVIPLTRSAPVANVSGRGRFHVNGCPVHGPGASGTGCSKFAHLPGSGRGPKQPNVFRYLIVIFRALTKPLFIFAFIVVTAYLAIHLLAHMTSNLAPNIGNIAPATTKPVTAVIHK